MEGWKGKLPCSSPKRPKARGLAQNGGPPGWPEASDPAEVFLHLNSYNMTVVLGPGSFLCASL
jgi:hypothetical protein